MTKLTTERLEKFVSDIKTDGMCDITDYQVALALRQLLAYEQAAKNPVAIIENSEYMTAEQLAGEEPHKKAVKELYEGALVVGSKFYATPVLPKQPESRNEIMAKGVEAFAKDWKGSARYSRISEVACNFAAKLRNGDADEC